MAIIRRVVIAVIVVGFCLGRDIVEAASVKLSKMTLPFPLLFPSPFFFSSKSIEPAIFLSATGHSTLVLSPSPNDVVSLRQVSSIVLLRKDSISRQDAPQVYHHRGGGMRI